MQYSKVLNLSFCNKFLKFFQKNRLLIILTFLFISGFTFSVFSSGKYEFIQNCTESYFKNFLYIKSNYTFIKMVFNSFLSSMLYLALCVISGSSMFGIIIVPLIIIFKGLMFGCVSSFLYSSFSFEGVAFHAVIILPSAIIFTITLIFCSIDAINFSLNLARLTFKEHSENTVFLGFKRLIYKLMIYSVFVLISAVVESLLSKSFIGNFYGIL